MLRNIANVTHDLEGLILNHKTQIQILIHEEIQEEDKNDLLNSVLDEAILLENYINILKDEAKAYSLEKINLAPIMQKEVVLT